MLEPINQLGKKIYLDYGIVKYLKDKFNIKSILDIGCGSGDMQAFVKQFNIKWVGVDGDENATRFNKNVIIHDYRVGQSPIKNNFDLAWSIEFLEHIEEQYILNFIPDFQRCKYALITSHKPHKVPLKNSKGLHVNEQYFEYWIDLFDKYNLIYNKEITTTLKERSTHGPYKHWIKRSGLFFINSVL